MHPKRNIRKSSQRRKPIIIGIVACIVVAAVATTVRVMRGDKQDPELSSLPDAPESWRNLATPKPDKATVAPSIGEDEQEVLDGASGVSGEFVDEFTHLAHTDPQAAAEVLARLNEGEERDGKLAILLDAWTDANPNAAADWVAGLPAGTFLEDATGHLVLRWGEADPETASAWVNDNIASGRQPTGATTFASAWTRYDPEAAIEWAGGIENIEARKEAYGAIAYQLGLDDPGRAGAWIATVDDPVLQDALATGLISTWAGKDPAAAAAWLDSGGLANASEAVRRKAALMLVSQWTIDDPRPASMWINALAEGPLKENAKASLAQTLSSEAPGDALIWAGSIIDNEERHQVVLGIYEDWVENNPADFKEQLVQRWSGISDPEVRKGIYALLYDYDPAFKEEVVQLIENAVSE